LRHILDSGEVKPSPEKKRKRRGVKLRELKLPEPRQFESLLENMDHPGGGFLESAPTWFVSWISLDAASRKPAR
jgi:hypothetical protein